jgi:hypothetical protein
LASAQKKKERGEVWVCHQRKIERGNSKELTGDDRGQREGDGRELNEGLMKRENG